MQKTKIPWCTHTWNPVVGCTKIATGCKNCYAEKMAHRLAHMGKEGYAHVTTKEGKWNGNIYHVFNNRLNQPLRWHKPSRIFVCSMSDLFHPEVSIGFLTHVFDVIKNCPQHIFQILTKRPEQALKMMWGKHGKGWRYFSEGSYHPNIWFGMSISTQKDLDDNPYTFFQIPAAVRFLSLEPMLESLRLVPSLFMDRDPEDAFPVACMPCRCGRHWEHQHDTNMICGLDQVIIGCESGPSRRPCKLEWVKDVIEQCDAAGVAVFVKQLEINGKVSKKMEDWPEWAQRQEYPNNG